jgi:hypothetical protein
MHDAVEASAKRASSYAKFQKFEGDRPQTVDPRSSLACVAVPLITVSWVELR